MKINSSQNCKIVLEELGNRIRQYRISIPMTQEELSRDTGISVRNLVRIENGEDTKLSNIIKILNQFDLIENMNLLIVDPEDRPSFHFKNDGKMRKRASKNKHERSK